LATSALVAIREEHLELAPSEACESILEGYIEGIKHGGRPLVLEEEQTWLRDIALSKLKNATLFWQKIESSPTVTAKTPAEVMKILRDPLPDPEISLRIVHRQAGLGSLGRPRYTAIGEWNGARIAREAKAILPNGMDWRRGTPGTQPDNMRRMLQHPLRDTDPMNHVSGHWIVRRLSPHCSRVELADLQQARDEEELLHAMGWETANVHLDCARTRARVKADILKRPRKWLLKAAREMTDATLSDWKTWRKHRKS
jgi:hypothetical protein